MAVTLDPRIDDKLRGIVTKHEEISRQLADPGVRRVLAISSLVVTCVELYIFYMPIYGHQLGLSASVIGMIIACYAAAAFLTPVATPANLMVMGPGAYRFGDYWKLGLPMLLLFVVVATFLVPLIWPF